MKPHFFFLFCCSLFLFGCTSQPPPVSEPVFEDTPAQPHVYEMRLVSESLPSSVGSGKIPYYKFRPHELRVSPGQQIAFTTTPELTDIIRVIQIRKSFGQSVYKEVMKAPLDAEHTIQYTFTEEGVYKMLCLRHSCSGEIVVATE